MRLLRGEGRPLVIGHRGAAAVASPNTLEALAAGVAAGADLVEFDVVAGLRLGHSEREVLERPPALDDALAYLAAQDVGAHVDLKVLGIEADVAAAVRRHGLAERVIVSTTWARSLRRLQAVAPELTRAISYPRDRYGAASVGWPKRATAGGAAALRAAMPARARLLLWAGNASVLTLHKGLVTPAVVRATHARGAALVAWTVNDPALVERLAGMGVDGIVSDDPAMALEVLKS